MIRTVMGRVVYERKKHLFSWKDFRRIQRSLRGGSTLEVWVTKSIQAFNLTLEKIEDEYVPAFEFSLKEFWRAIKSGDWEDREVYEQLFFEDQDIKGRSIQETLDETLATIEGKTPDKGTSKSIGAAMVASMLDIIEEIEEYYSEGE